MNKSDLIETLVRKLPNLSGRDVEVIVNTIFDSMTDSLKSGERIEIRGFGSFEVRTRKPRIGRNPKTGMSVDVGQRKVPFFKVGKELRERVNKA
ncbi:MAG TPA: integration host factor subunit beta [bacterium]|nr:integration host factor subunit beta [Myxococcales bacterium]OQA59489.1 MAG: Integration host factor subunit beta [bacterium ADurb.Bin270]HPW45096.1 integration host factor subunit beta [bacterium]